MERKSECDNTHAEPNLPSSIHSADQLTLILLHNVPAIDQVHLLYSERNYSGGRIIGDGTTSCVQPRCPFTNLLYVPIDDTFYCSTTCVPPKRRCVHRLCSLLMPLMPMAIRHSTNVHMPLPVAICDHPQVFHSILRLLFEQH